MSGSQEGNTLAIGDQQRAPISFPDQKGEQRLRGRLTGAQGKALAVRITPAERPDVEGHALDAAALESVWLNVQLEGDDTEGHAIRVSFPTAGDAAKFRQNVIAAGILAGSIVLVSAGAIAITSNVPRDGGGYVVDQQQVQGFSVPTGINPATDRPWGRGFLERSDGEISGPADEAAPVLERPAGRGPLETVE